MIRVEGCVRGCSGPAEGDGTRIQGQNGTEVGVARAAMPDRLVAYAVLLAGEGHRSKGGRLEVGVGAREGVEDPGADPELEILEAK